MFHIFEFAFKGARKFNLANPHLETDSETTLSVRVSKEQAQKKNSLSALHWNLGGSLVRNIELESNNGYLVVGRRRRKKRTKAK